MQAEIVLAVLEKEKYKHYSGQASVHIPSKEIYSVFHFELFEPYLSKSFVMTVTKDNKVIFKQIDYPTPSQMDSYTKKQIAIFNLLYRCIFDSVKLTMLFNVGVDIRNRRKTSVNFVSSGFVKADEKIIPSTSFKKNVRWEEKDTEVFKEVCSILS